MGDDTVEQYVLMPRRALRARMSDLSAAAAPFLESLHGFAGVSRAPSHISGIRCRVVDSIRSDGPKLVEVARGDIPALRTAYPALDLVPVVYYAPAIAPRAAAVDIPAAAGPGAAPEIRLTIVDGVSNRPIGGSMITALTDFANKKGQTVVSDENGIAVLNLGPVAVERLYVYPPLVGYWGHFRKNFALGGDLTIKLRPIDCTQPDSVRHFYRTTATNVGEGVTVGIIDGGVGPHPHLVCEGDIDNGKGHGTHVAGIIAGRGMPPNGVRGVAPGVKLKSYRVFADGNLAPNFSIAKAIDKAVTDDKCDILNLSFTLQGVGDDPAVRGALEDARAAGVLPIAAAGNDYRQPVGFPARDSMCIAVTALGRRDIIADGSIEVADVVAPYGSDANDFIAAFSNLGPEVDATAPGSGVVSTVPAGYGVLSGTSMACPVVVGLAARLLSRDQQLLNMPRNSDRSAGLAQLVLRSAASLGFAAELQGAGLVQMQAEV